MSVQLAYKVPVLSSQDRRLLQAPSRRSPGPRKLSAGDSDNGPDATSRVHAGEEVVARCSNLRLGAEIPGLPALRGSMRNMLRDLSQSLRAVRVLWVEGNPYQGRPVVRSERPLPSPRRAEPVHLLLTEACPASLSRVVNLSLGERRSVQFLELLLRRCRGLDPVHREIPARPPPPAISLKMHLCRCVPNG